MNITGYPHFPNSFKSVFPLILLKNQYIQKSIDDPLVWDPKHQNGTFIRKFNLIHWSNLSEVFAHLETVSYLDELLLTGNLDLTDENFVQLVHFAATIIIIKLDICGCKSLSSIGLSNICKLSFLRDVNISKIEALSDSIVEEILQSLPSLASLDVSENPQLTNSTVFAVIKYMSARVSNFKMSGNPNITDRAVNDLTLHCENIRAVDLSNCPHVNFFGVVIQAPEMLQYVSRNELIELNLNGSKKLSVDSLSWIASAVPSLTGLFCSFCSIHEIMFLTFEIIPYFPAL